MMSCKKIIEMGLEIADSNIYEEDKIWSRYSNDKVDIGEELAKVIRVLSKALPIAKPLRALSIGSSAEPQFRILETAFRGGLYLLDTDKKALAIVDERIRRQRTSHVTAILADYNKIFLNPQKTKLFLRNKLDRKRIDLITLHHSLYYCNESMWRALFRNLCNIILAPKGAMHAVLMASESNDQRTTTWLYNHFVGKYFRLRNKQNLRSLKRELEKGNIFKKSKIILHSNHVYFHVDDFKKLMSVVWMILLYPGVHKYSAKEREEITEFVYKRFWKKNRPLIQEQDHLTIYRNVKF